MGLAHRIIPVLLMRNFNLVKGKRFDSSRVVGNIFQAAEIHQARGVDEMLVIDVGATLSGSEPNYQIVRDLTEKCFMPITVGGGIQNTDHIRGLLNSGADKVLLGTTAYDDPSMITRAANKFGSQAISVAIDVLYEDGVWCMSTRCGTVLHCYSPVTFAKEMEDRGAGELIVTAIRNDGMMAGYDLGLIRKIAKEVSIPVVANGGCGTYEHMHRALKAGASAVAGGSIFQWTDQTPREAAEYLSTKGWEIRL